MEQESRKAEFEYDLQLFAEEGNDDKEGQDGDDNKGDDAKGKDIKDELEELKKSADEILDNEAFEKDAAKALLNTLFDKMKTKEIAYKKVLGESIDRRHKLRDLEKEKEENEEKALKEKEQYKELYEKLKEKYDVYETDVVKTTEYFETQFNRKMEQLPPKYHNLVPENIDIRDKISWIEKFMTTIVEETKGGGKKTDDKKPEEQNKSSVNVGGGPTKSPPEGTETAEKQIAEEIKGAKNRDELLRILRSHGRRG